MIDRIAGWYDPLPRVLSTDTFGDGQGGWTDLRPNFVGPDFSAHSGEIDLEHWGSIMLSSATYAFSGTHGALSGTWSLRLPTRHPADPPDRAPAPGSMSLAIKRLSRPAGARLLRIEAMFAYTTEQDRPGLGVDAMRSFGMFVDLQDGEHRWMPGVRYVNCAGGRRQRRWQFYSPTTDDDTAWSYGREGWHFAGVDPQWFGSRHADGSTSAATWFDGADQPLLYNETDDKINWMPMALTVDMDARRYVAFRCGRREYTFPPGAAPTLAPGYADIADLINPVFFVETDGDRRVSLYLDSVVVSMAGEPEQ